ncbi:GH25 family lysozyme M1 (1,4-beta-N-acetylmuramidase) [Arthrobacter ginsengisoli]|uniref:GH25 family lysozyme M1 (1,4-beta-N-acetylmuramidase) n=1 Tax=Arthrobacter ginsengisoli TaxID=1356565 RepID=A0ABU1UD42_9MICC|nr:GH25 family lysozyme [Arthrobacter ginsengisoli]MDR7083045.1 GH25 family lysozyme M1 (1,4-beta-N-acetylmuramidase) [Arthrobacter ginsengisoli]
MKRTVLPPTRHLGSRVGATLLAVSLIAGPGLATPASAVEPAPTATAAAPTAPPAPAATATPTLSPAPAPATVTATAAPSASAQPPVDRTSAAYRSAMTEATKAGGAEMGQGTRAAGGSPAGDTTAATEALATEGTWMPSYGVQGLDVSKYQAGINWQTEWNMGARFAYIKATEGNYYTSTTFSDQYLGSRAVGMIRGAYHFANPAASSGAAQARIFVQNGGVWSADGYTLPPVLDFEGNPYAGQTIGGYYQGNTCYDMTPAQLTSWARDFGNTMQALTGRLPVMYTTTTWWNYCTGGPSGFGDWPLWIARWPSSPSDSPGALPSSWANFSFWQYSESGPFANGGDSNVWNGDYTSLKRFATGSAPPPPPPPPAPPVPTDPTRRLVSPGDFDGDGQADQIQRRADGELWLYPGNGAGQYLAGRRIGSGWGIYDRVLGVGDYNSDGKNDLVARKLDGSLWFYAGTGRVSGTDEGYRPVVRIGEYGWNAFDSLLGVRDFDGDQKPDLAARTPDGSLYLYSGTGTGQTGTARKIDYGWQIFDQLIAIQDFDGDGTNDLAGRRADGTLLFYSNNGRAGLVNGRQIGTGWGVYDDIVGTGDSNGDRMSDFVAGTPTGAVYFYAGTAMKDEGYQGARKIGEYGWGAFNALVAVQDFNGDGKGDLLARKPDGTLWFYPGNGTGSYGSAKRIGDYGWDAFDAFAGVGDFNGDGKNDLVARKPDGTLWLYAGTGRVDSASNGYAGARKIGLSGWEIFDTITGAGDLNGDGRNDLLARQSNGALWLYKGTGKVDAANSGYQGGVKVGDYGWEAFDQLFGAGDFNADGRNDLLARRPDGTLWFYAGDGSGKPGAAVRIGTGWNVYDRVLNGWNLNGDGNPDLVARRPDGSLWAYSGTGMKPSEGYLPRTLAVVL